MSVPLLSTRVKKPIASLKEEDNDDDDTLGAIKGDINNGDNEQEDEEDEGDAEDLEEDECVSHPCKWIGQ